MRFTQNNVPKLFHLRKEIDDCSQGNMSISVYFTRFRTLVDGLESITSVPIATKVNEYDQGIKLIQFLMGNNDT